MKILYITATPLEYNSSANMRNIALIKGFKELGYEVSTLSASFNKNSIYVNNIENEINFKQRYWIETGKLQSNISNNIGSKNKFKKKIKEIIYKIYTKFSIYDSRKNSVKKLDKVVINEKFDLIISSSDPKSAHLIAEKLIKNNSSITKKWIQYWGDPFIGDINKNTIIPDNFIRKEEKRLISLCDKVVYVSPFTLEKQQKIYKQFKNKMIFIPIPFYKEKIYNNIENKKVTLGYFGDYNSKDRDILPLYNVLVNNININLKICGNSDLNLNNTDNIEIKLRQKKEIIDEIEKKVDILVCICNRKGTQIPGKIYHYAATNKPILIILDGDKKEQLKQYFNSYNRYELCENTEDSIYLGIHNIIKNKIDYRPLELLNAKNIAKQFLEYMN